MRWCGPQPHPWGWESHLEHRKTASFLGLSCHWYFVCALAGDYSDPCGAGASLSGVAPCKVMMIERRPRLACITKELQRATTSQFCPAISIQCNNILLLNTIHNHTPLAPVPLDIKHLLQNQSLPYPSSVLNEFPPPLAQGSRAHHEGRLSSPRYEVHRLGLGHRSDGRHDQKRSHHQYVGQNMRLRYVSKLSSPLPRSTSPCSLRAPHASLHNPRSFPSKYHIRSHS